MSASDQDPQSVSSPAAPGRCPKCGNDGKGDDMIWFSRDKYSWSFAQIECEACRFSVNKYDPDQSLACWNGMQGKADALNYELQDARESVRLAREALNRATVEENAAERAVMRHDMEKERKAARSDSEERTERSEAHKETQDDD